MNTDKFPQDARRSLEEVDSIEASYTINLTSLAKTGKLDPVIGRDEEIRRLTTTLLHRTRNNAILVGERGVGKTSIVKGLAQRIITGDVPAILTDWRILSLDSSTLSSDVAPKDKLEQRVRHILKEIADSKVVCCLFIDDLHLLASTEKEHTNLYDLLNSVFAKGKLHHFILTTTPAEFQNFREKNRTLEEQFVQIPVQEPTSRETASVLRGLKGNWETHYGIQISDDAVREAVALAGHNLPQSAIDLMDATLALVQLTTQSGPETLGNMERKNKQLKDEIQSLEQDTSESSIQYLAEAAEEQMKLEKRLKPLQELHENLQALSEDVKQMKVNIETAKSKLARAEKEQDFMKAADLKYYAIPDMEEKLRSLKSDEVKASGALYDQILDEDSRVFFTQAIGLAQIKKMADRLTREKGTLLSPNSTTQAVEVNELLASNPPGIITELATQTLTPLSPASDQRNELPALDKHPESSELPTHQTPPGAGDISGTELEGSTKQTHELSDTSKVELEAFTSGPRYELASNPIRGKIELESPERYEVPAADVERRPELEGSWVPDLPELGDENLKGQGDVEVKDKEKAKWKGKLKGLISRGK